MNILLTGKYNIGKTTLLKRLLDELNLEYSGYTSSAIEEDKAIIGFKMNAMDEQNESFTIGIKDTPFTCQPVTEAFEKKGTNLLKRSLEKTKSVIILDELGFLESEAHNFQKAVFDCFDSPQLVIGILKGRNTPFLMAIRAREDIHFFNVTDFNHEKVYLEIKELIKGEN